MNTHEMFANIEALLPSLLWLRIFVVLIGAAMFIHTICMAGFLHPKTPWSLTILISIVSASGLGMFIGGLYSELMLILLSSVIGSGSLIVTSLWLWSKGFHVSKFVAELG